MGIGHLQRFKQLLIVALIESPTDKILGFRPQPVFTVRFPWPGVFLHFLEFSDWVSVFNFSVVDMSLATVEQSPALVVSG